MRTHAATRESLENNVCLRLRVRLYSYLKYSYTYYVHIYKIYSLIRVSIVECTSILKYTLEALHTYEVFLKQLCGCVRSRRVFVRREETRTARDSVNGMMPTRGTRRRRHGRPVLFKGARRSPLRSLSLSSQNSLRPALPLSIARYS